VDLGTNSRLTAIAGAVLRIKLRRLSQWTAARRENAGFYDRAFAGLAPRLLPLDTDPRAHHVYHQYTLRSSDREALREHLTRQKIENVVYYPIPVHLQPCFADLGGRPGQFPEAERGAREIVSIPVHSELRETDRQRVAQVMTAWARSGPGSAGTRS